MRDASVICEPISTVLQVPNLKASADMSSRVIDWTILRALGPQSPIVV